MTPAQVVGLARASFAAYPTVTVINIADVLQRIESVVEKMTFVIRFLPDPMGTTIMA